MRPHAILFAALLLATPALAQTPAPRSEPAPWAALTSADAAMKVAFDKICLPAIVDGESIEALSLANHLLPVPPKSAGVGPSEKVWRLASLGKVFVVAWADGSCTSSSDRGDPQALTQQVLAAAAAKGIVLHRGQESIANDSGRRVAWCSEGPQPWVLAITTPGEKRSRRPAMLTTLFKAKGEAPSFCRRAPEL